MPALKRSCQGGRATARVITFRNAKMVLMTRTLQAWILLAAFAFAGLPSLGWLALGRAGSSCCGSASCCANGRCPMRGMNQAKSAPMPVNCPMNHAAAPAKSGAKQCQLSCRCSISQSPALFIGSSFNPLRFAPARSSAEPIPFAGSKIQPNPTQTVLDGHAPQFRHPPRFLS